jgi:hypothetical protein
MAQLQIIQFDGKPENWRMYEAKLLNKCLEHGHDDILTVTH